MFLLSVLKAISQALVGEFGIVSDELKPSDV